MKLFVSLLFLFVVKLAAAPVQIVPADNQLPLPNQAAPLGQKKQAPGFLPDFEEMAGKARRAALQKRLETSATLRRSRVEVFRKKTDPKVLKELAKGAELTDVINGRPLFTAPTNSNAALTSATNFVRDHADFLNVNGDGFRVGVWEVGIGTRHGHRDWDDRYFFRDALVGDTDVRDHPTHVIGTIAASGEEDISVRGMAPGATVIAYDSADHSAEMMAEGADSRTAAVSQSLVPVSNHSYGTRAGWRDLVWYGTWGLAEDEIFGLYDITARDWDEIVHNLEFYLPFKSAGNDRNDSGPAPGARFGAFPGGVYQVLDNYNPGQNNHPPLQDGTFDTIPTYGNAKNIMTVGAVNDGVGVGNFRGAPLVRVSRLATMSAFSGWGPTDDGRIKPDIVANGVGVTSTGNTWSNSGIRFDRLTAKDGTSMASPTAAGSAILLNHYWYERFGANAMRAATMKGLIIHTADDLGNPGPDYQFGWGLMNTLTAARKIKEHADFPERSGIFEGTLAGGATHTFTINTFVDSPGLRVTLCYSDPAGPVQTALDSPVSVLVNDLDIQLKGIDGRTHRPYVLDPANPDRDATTGDNVRDNIEQIFIESPSEMLTLTLSHKGDLSGDLQNYSLIITGGAVAGQPDSIAVRPDQSYFQDFQRDKLPTFQGWDYFQRGAGRKTQAFGSLRMDDASPGGGDAASNVATLYLDLAGQENVFLNFWWRDYLDDPHTLPQTLIGEILPEGDGVMVSADGGRKWHGLINLDVANRNQWSLENFNLTLFLTSHGYSNFSDVRVRFLQFGTQSFPGDGIDFDNVAVYLANPGTFSLALDDPGAGVHPNNPDRYLIDEAAGSITLLVRRDAGSDGAVSVDYATSDFSARAGSDYDAISGTLNFKDGETSKSLSIPITSDTLEEGAESFYLELTNPTGGALLTGNPERRRISILDDDAIPEMAAGPDEIFPVAIYKSDALPQSLVVFNRRNGVLRYKVTEKTSWLSIAEGADGAVSEDELGYVTVAYDTDDLNPGRYRGIITIADTDGHNPDLEVEVNLLIGFEGETVSVTSNEKSIDLPGNPDGTASVFPLTIDVPSLAGRLLNVTVGINNLTHARMDDLDMMLLPPEGIPVGILSDVSGNQPLTKGFLTISATGDKAPLKEPLQNPGFYRPTDYEPGVDELAGNTGGFDLWLRELGDFSGLPPVGQWKLYVGDDRPAEDDGFFSNADLFLQTVTLDDMIAEKFATSKAFDLLCQSLVFRPATESSPGYQLVRYEIQDLLVPQAGTFVKPGAGNPIKISPGQSLTFYGEEVSTIWVGSRGEVFTVDPVDNDPAFGDLPTLAVIGMDLDEDSGNITFQELADRIVLTWVKVIVSDTGAPITAQLEWFFDGTIRQSYLQADETSSAFIGLTRGSSEEWSRSIRDLTDPRNFLLPEIRGWSLDEALQSTLTVPTEPDVGYELSRSADLQGWKRVEAFTGNGGIQVFQYKENEEPHGFYRVERVGKPGNGN